MTPHSTMQVPGGKQQKRAEARKAVRHSAILHYMGAQIPVVLHDMSRGGVRIGLNASRAGLVIEGTVILEVPGALRLPLKVRWQKSTVIGAAFDIPASRKATYQPQIDRLMARYGR